MAIVLCKGCKQEVSSKAKVCPHCGYPLEDERDAFDDIEGKKKEHPFDEDRKRIDDSQRKQADERRHSPPYGPPGPMASPADSKATTGMILAIVGLLLPFPFIDIILALVGLVMGLEAHKMPNLRRRGQATAAIVIGVIALIFNISFWLFAY